MLNDHPKRRRGSLVVAYISRAHSRATRTRTRADPEMVNSTRRFTRLPEFGVLGVADSAAVILQHCGGRLLGFRRSRPRSKSAVARVSLLASAPTTRYAWASLRR